MHTDEEFRALVFGILKPWTTTEKSPQPDGFTLALGIY